MLEYFSYNCHIIIAQKAIDPRQRVYKPKLCGKSNLKIINKT